ncbi:DUF1572 domain-containing protein [Inquilinus sp. KBS0705]|nr:DUF1572 domain-containing protein [Inquilinus sp. KBS0705]
MADIDDYLQSVKKQFAYYRSLGEKTFAQVNDDALFWCYNDESNSIAIIVKHLWGNMLSRWTDFLTSDGEKEWRQRDAEFENDINSREELLSKWNEGWDSLFAALDTVNNVNWQQDVFIRNERHSIMDAIERQVAHYAYHVGQIVFIGKMISGDQWRSLTIPKGKTGEFNKGMMKK